MTFIAWTWPAKTYPAGLTCEEAEGLGLLCLQQSRDVTARGKLKGLQMAYDAGLTILAPPPRQQIPLPSAGAIAHRYGPELRARLGDLDGMGQLTVSCRNEQPVLPAKSGQDWLAQRCVAQRAREQIKRSVEDWANMHRFDMVLHLHTRWLGFDILVPKEDLSAAATNLSSLLTLSEPPSSGRITLTGPWPPLSFGKLTLASLAAVA